MVHLSFYTIMLAVIISLRKSNNKKTKMLKNRMTTVYRHSAVTLVYA